MKSPLLSVLVGASLLFPLACGVGCSKSEGLKFNEKVDVSALVQQLKSDNPEQRVDACTKLAEGGPYSADAVEPLTAALKDTDPLVKSLAAYALGQIGPKAASAVPALKELMQAGEEQTAPAALNAIRAIDPSQAPAEQISNTMEPQKEE